MPLVEVGLPALALVVAVRNPRVPELHTLLAKLSITYRWCAEHCPAPPHLSSLKVSGCSALSLAFSVLRSHIRLSRQKEDTETVQMISTIRTQLATFLQVGYLQ